MKKFIVTVAIVFMSLAPVVFASTLNLGSGTEGGSVIGFGYITYGQLDSQTFTAPSSDPLNSVTFDVRSQSSPSDGVEVLLESTSLGVPSGTVLATSGAISSIPNSYTTETFTFGSPYTMTSGTVYAFVLSRTGSLTDASNFRVNADTTNTYAGGSECYSMDSTSWSCSSVSLHGFFTYTPSVVPLAIGSIGTNVALGSSGSGTGVLGLYGATGVHDLGVALLVVLGAFLGLAVAYLLFKFAWRKVRQAPDLGRSFTKRDFRQFKD